MAGMSAKNSRCCLCFNRSFSTIIISPTSVGPTGGNVRPAAISSNIFFDNGLVAYCTVDDHPAEFPKTASTGNFLPDLPPKSASSGYLHRQSASAGMENGTCRLAIASYRTFPSVGPYSGSYKQQFPTGKSQKSGVIWDCYISQTALIKDRLIVCQGGDSWLNLAVRPDISMVCAIIPPWQLKN